MKYFQDVKLGSNDAHQLSVDLDESLLSGLLQQQQSQIIGNTLHSGSPPHSGRTSPPVTPSSANIFQQPNYQQIALPQQQPITQQLLQYQSQQEPLELQIDYWPINKPIIDKDKNQKAIDQGKNSIKGTFRSLQVCFCFLSSFLLFR